MADAKDEPSGVAGWLLFFILTLGIFRPAIGPWRVISTIELDPRIGSAFGANWPAIRIAEWSIILIDIAMCVFLALRLCIVRRWSSVKLAIAGIWIAIFLITLAEPIAVSIISGVPFSRLIGVAARTMLQGLIYSVLWTSYLLRSKRVANTYHRRADEEELHAVFS